MLKFVNSDVVFQEVPDEISLAINLSNCPNNCVGCHSSYLKNDIGSVLDEDSLQDLITPYVNSITCVCFMGGDIDPDRVLYLAKWIKTFYHQNIKVAWYSGKSKLPDSFDFSFFDYIKLGPYIASLGALKSKTTNQHMYRISNKQMVDITSRFWLK